MDYQLTNQEAITAQQALVELNKVELPVRVSMDIAILTNIMEKQVRVFSDVRNKLFKQYDIKVEPGEIPGSARFTCTMKDETKRQETLEKFLDAFNELTSATGEKFSYEPIKVPQKFNDKDVAIRGEVLLPLIKFIVLT
jgi:hypothetical protein